jgi:cobalamin biosynthesis Mg chelatase CobN
MSEQGGGNVPPRNPDTSGQQGWRPVPDPTVLTTDAINQAVSISRDYTDGKIAVIVERLRGIDVATRLLNEEVNRVPSKLTLAVEQLQAVVGERFDSIDRQFKERDVRAEREAESNKAAVSAALSAQKDAATAHDEANEKAIAKSEVATHETITKLSQLVDTQIRGLSDKIDDLKERVDRGEAVVQGQAQNRFEYRAEKSESHSMIQVVIGVVVTVAAIVALMLSLYAAVKPDPVQTRIIEVPAQTTPTEP